MMYGLFVTVPYNVVRFFIKKFFLQNFFQIISELLTLALAVGMVLFGYGGMFLALPTALFIGLAAAPDLTRKFIAFTTKLGVKLSFFLAKNVVGRTLLKLVNFFIGAFFRQKPSQIIRELFTLSLAATLLALKYGYYFPALGMATNVLPVLAVVGMAIAPIAAYLKIKKDSKISSLLFSPLKLEWAHDLEKNLIGWGKKEVYKLTGFKIFDFRKAGFDLITKGISPELIKEAQAPSYSVTIKISEDSSLRSSLGELTLNSLFTNHGREGLSFEVTRDDGGVVTETETTNVLKFLSQNHISVPFTPSNNIMSDLIIIQRGPDGKIQEVINDKLRDKIIEEAFQKRDYKLIEDYVCARKEYIEKKYTLNQIQHAINLEDVQKNDYYSPKWRNRFGYAWYGLLGVTLLGFLGVMIPFSPYLLNILEIAAVPHHIIGLIGQVAPWILKGGLAGVFVSSIGSMFFSAFTNRAKLLETNIEKAEIEKRTQIRDLDKEFGDYASLIRGISRVDEHWKEFVDKENKYGAFKPYGTLGKVGCELIVKWLSSFSAGQEPCDVLNLSRCSIEAEGAQIIAKSLANKENNFRAINLGGSLLGDGWSNTMKEFANSLKDNCNVTELLFDPVMSRKVGKKIIKNIEHELLINQFIANPQDPKFAPAAQKKSFWLKELIWGKDTSFADFAKDALVKIEKVSQNRPVDILGFLKRLKEAADSYGVTLEYWKLIKTETKKIFSYERKASDNAMLDELRTLLEKKGQNRGIKRSSSLSDIKASSFFTSEAPESVSTDDEARSVASLNSHGDRTTSGSDVASFTSASSQGEGARSRHDEQPLAISTALAEHSKRNHLNSQSATIRQRPVAKSHEDSAIPTASSPSQNGARSSSRFSSLGSFLRSEIKQKSEDAQKHTKQK
jgi:hypothetical protein